MIIKCNLQPVYLSIYLSISCSTCVDLGADNYNCLQPVIITLNQCTSSTTDLHAIFFKYHTKQSLSLESLQYISTTCELMCTASLNC